MTEPTGTGHSTPSTPNAQQLSAMSNAELDVLGARMDGVELTTLGSLPPAGSVAEQRAERQVALCFGLAGFFSLAFVVVFWGSGWFLPDWEFQNGDTFWGALYTPLLGLTMGSALLFLGLGIVLWAKKLVPHEVATQERHEGASEPVDAQTASGSLLAGVERLGVARRKVVRRALLGAGGALGLMALMPLGGLIRNPGRGDELTNTSWREGMRLLREDGTPIRPADMQPGALETVFPPVERGNLQADSATMLIRLYRDQAAEVRSRGNEAGFEDYLAYSKICTHAGCPVSLYEDQTGRILCPCHQSQFDVTRDAASVFGPATRSLPQLPIDIDDEGFFVALGDYPEPVGPSYWNREK